MIGDANDKVIWIREHQPYAPPILQWDEHMEEVYRELDRKDRSLSAAFAGWCVLLVIGLIGGTWLLWGMRIWSWG